ncbi:MAG: cephalosporin hydroxylase family protein [Thermoanaerobaculia bacterium]
MTPFEKEVAARVAGQRSNGPLRTAANAFMLASVEAKYSYNFSWLGRPIIQYPQDIVVVQELIWRVRPDLVIETGIAHGGSLVLSASILALLEYSEAAESGTAVNPRQPRRRVLGIDIDIRAHNRAAMERHPMRHRIDMIEGSSVDPAVVARVREFAAHSKRVLVFLDSNHTHEHVLAELEAFAPLTSTGSYCVVFDTVVESLPEELCADRPWGPADNPRTAVREYLSRLDQSGRVAEDGDPLRLESDQTLTDKMLITAAPGGFLRRI